MRWPGRLRPILARLLVFARIAPVRQILRYGPLLVLLTIYVFWAARVIPGYRYQINPDGTGYIGIAQKVLAGRLADSVNAYWSPLYSWLMVPLLACRIPPLLAVKILDAGVGGVVIIASWIILRHVRARIETRVLAALALMPMVLHFGMTVITPDLLVAAVVLVYLAWLTRPRWGSDRYSGAITGVLGALCYLAKAYALPFWLAHFAIAGGIELIRRRGERLTIAMHLVAAGLTFAVIAGAWGTALKHKYGYFTLGSTGRFNLAYNGPGFSMPHRLGFLPPPNPSAISAWEDATILPVTTWNPRGTPAEREHFSKNIDRNIENLWKIAEQFNPHYVLIAAAGIALVATAVGPQPRRPGFALVVALLLWPCGYLVLHIERRFIVLTCFLMLLSGGFALSAVAHALPLGIVRRTIAAAVLCWSFLYLPDYNAKAKNPPPRLGRWSLARGWGVDKRYPERAEVLRGLLPPRAKVASDGNWSDALYLSFHLDLAYYGIAPPATSEQIRKRRDLLANPDLIASAVREHPIEYLLVYSNPAYYPFLKSYQELPGAQQAGVRVYRLAPPAPATTRGVLTAP